MLCLPDAHVCRWLQVHPAKLTTALLHAAQSAGARLIHGTVEGVQLNAAGNGVEGEVEWAAAVFLLQYRYAVDLTQVNNTIGVNRQHYSCMVAHGCNVGMSLMPSGAVSFPL